MDESIIKQLEQQTEKPSALIRRGIQLLDREHSGQWCQCALGAAWAGKNGRQMTRAEQAKYMHSSVRLPDSIKNETDAAIGRDVGLPSDIAVELSERHSKGHSALNCADWLETKGF